MTAPDFAELFQKAQQAQQKIAQLQRDLAQRRVEGQSGGGMVTVVATGALQILEIRIEPSLLQSGDTHMIQDLTTAAVNAGSAIELAVLQATTTISGWNPSRNRRHSRDCRMIVASDLEP